ncbi:hypothetical protein GW17_00038587 [Ensete ventricosum]|nr:hypothetical protein GW17_00038587 [Ensete ventricosum]
MSVYSLLSLVSSPRSDLSIGSMEFTDAYKQTGPCCFSPNSRYLAVAVDYRLVIRDVVSLKVKKLIAASHCGLFIKCIKWKADNSISVNKILCVMLWILDSFIMDHLSLF